MINLLYTGVPTSDSFQSDATKSLGGYISSTNFYNGVESNIFPSLTVSQIKSKESQYRLLALKITAPIADLKIWIESESTLCQFKLAFVEPDVDNCNKAIFETIPYGNIQPSQAVFATYSSTSQPLSSFITDAVVGIWIKQEIKDTAYQSVLSDYDCDNIEEVLEDDKKLINFVIKVSYN